MTLTAFDIIINIFQSIIHGYFPFAYVKEVTQKGFWLGVSVSTLLHFFVLLILNTHYVYEGLSALLYIVPIVVSLLIFSKENIYEILALAIIDNILISVGNCFSLFLMRITTHFNILNVIQNDVINNLSGLISSMIIIILYVYLIKNKRKLRLLNFNHPVLYLVVYSLFFFAVTSIETMLFSLKYDENTILMSYVFIILLFLCAVYTMIKTREEFISYTNHSLLSKQLEMLEENFSQIEESNRRTQKIRHDLKRVFFLMESYLKNDEIEKAKELIGEQIGEIEQEKTMPLTGSVMIDSILSNKLLECKKKDIYFQQTIDVRAMRMIDEKDLAIFLMNGIDNAMEHISKVEKKISLKIFARNDVLFVEIINTVDYDVLKDNEELITTKDDKVNHGYGVVSMRLIAEKYNGEVMYMQEENNFITLGQFSGRSERE